MQFEPEQQGCRVGLADAWHPGCLAQGGGPNLAELLARFFGERCNPCVVDGVRQGAVFLLFDAVDLLTLPAEIAAVFDINFGAFAHIFGQAWIG